MTLYETVLRGRSIGRALARIQQEKARQTQPPQLIPMKKAKKDSLSKVRTAAQKEAASVEKPAKKGVIPYDEGADK